MREFVFVILIASVLSCSSNQNYKEVQIVFSAGNNPSEFPRAFRIEDNGTVILNQHPNSGQSNLCGKLSSSQLKSIFLEFHHLGEVIDKYGDENFVDGVWVEFMTKTKNDSIIKSKILHLGEMSNSDYQIVESITRTCELTAVENCNRTLEVHSKLFNEQDFIPPVPE